MRKGISKTRPLAVTRQSFASVGAVAVLGILLPSAAMAQEDKEVVVEFAGGQDTMSGTLLDFKDNKLFIESSVGLVVMPADGVVCYGAVCPESTRPVPEDTSVVLTALDGSMSITGEELEVDGQEYVVKTAFGTQRVSINLVDCEGAGCLEVEELVAGPVSTEVVLSNGALNLKGEFLGVEGGSYILNESTMGEIRVSIDQFACDGTACPPT